MDRDAIEVWLARTDVDAETLARMSELLDGEERRRAARYRFDDDRARSIVARATLRHLLAQHLGRDPRELRFTAGAHGKPSLEGGELQFNVSHSGERVAIAIAAATPVGIDIEHDRAMRDPVALAHRFFSPAESAAVEQDPSRFLAIWTAKESVIKAIGGGLSIDLSSFEAFATPDRFAPIAFKAAATPPHSENWNVLALPVDGGYRGALAARGGAWRVKYRGREL